VYGAAAAVAFLLELAALAALAYWGSTVSVALAVLLPLALAAVWGLVASPRARVQLPPLPKTIVRCALLLSSAVALAAARQWTLAIVFAVAIVCDQAVLVAVGRPVAGADG
jgi:Protein of unknown function (DUF2568)